MKQVVDIDLLKLTRKDERVPSKHTGKSLYHYFEANFVPLLLHSGNAFLIFNSLKVELKTR